MIRTSSQPRYTKRIHNVYSNPDGITLSEADGWFKNRAPPLFMGGLRVFKAGERFRDFTRFCRIYLSNVLQKFYRFT